MNGTLLSVLAVLSIIALALVSIKLAMGIGIDVGAYINARQGLAVDKLNAQLNRMLKKEGDRIMPAFDLWWADTGKKLAEQSDLLSFAPYGQTKVPVEPGNEDEHRQAMMMYVREEALALARHIHGQSHMEAFMPKFRRFNTDTSADELLDDYVTHTGHHRTALTNIGFDVEQLEKQFAPA